MEITLLISFLILLTYVVSIIAMFGVPSSLSDSFYLLQNKYPNKNWKWFFTLLCFAISFTILIPWIDISNESLQLLPFLSAAGLTFVGVAPHFKSYEKKMHEAGAWLCAACSQLWCILSGMWYTPLIGIGAMAIPALIQKKNYTFYLEMAAFLSTYLGIFIKYFKNGQL